MTLNFHNFRPKFSIHFKKEKKIVVSGWNPPASWLMVDVARFLCIPRTLFPFRIFTVSVEVNLLLLPQKFLFLCASSIDFPHVEYLGPISR